MAGVRERRWTGGEEGKRVQLERQQWCAGQREPMSTIVCIVPHTPFAPPQTMMTRVFICGMKSASVSVSCQPSTMCHASQTQCVMPAQHKCHASPTQCVMQVQHNHPNSIFLEFML